MWAAGIRAPEFLAELDGLESNSINLLIVGLDLSTTKDKQIFAIGDCAACPKPDGSGSVLPRAQAAHQMATYLFRNFQKILSREEIPPYVYRDYNSLVSLSSFTTVGS